MTSTLIGVAPSLAQPRSIVVGEFDYHLLVRGVMHRFFDMFTRHEKKDEVSAKLSCPYHCKKEKKH